MKPRIWLPMLAVVAGIVFWLSGESSDQAVGSDIPPTSELEAPLPTDATLKMVKDAHSDSARNAEASHDSRTETQPPLLLAESKGRALKEAMEAFWLQCRRQGNCSERLEELRASLSQPRYDLLSRYPEVKMQWQRVLGDLQLDSYNSLADKIAEVKRQARLVWGELAQTVLADEFALYDFTVESQQLDNSEAENYLEDYQNMLAKWQGTEGALSLDSNAAIYEKGVSLIPAHYSEAQHRQAIKQLAEHYLTPEQSTSLVERDKQVAAQQTQVLDYQSQLSQLTTALQHQRATTHSHMPDSEWQQHVEQQISEFRVEFFRGD